MTDETELAPVVALASGKGGVGKSTLALALADVYRSLGWPVALVDFDAQGGVTLAAGLKRPESPLTDPGVSAHGLTVFRGARGLSEAPRAALATRLEQARQGAGLVVVDLSPALTDAAHAVAFEAAALLVVVAKLDAAGLVNVGEAVALGDAAGVPVAIVPTFKTTTGLSREAEAFLRGRYGDRVTVATIPTDARAAEAAGVGKPVTITARRSKVATAMHELGAELVERFGIPHIRPLEARA